MADRVATLRTNLITALRAIPSLVTLLDGQEGNIVEYKDENAGDLFQYIRDFHARKNALLVGYQGRVLGGRFPGMRTERFSLIPAVRGSASEILEAIETGVPTTGDGETMINCLIDLAYYPMEVPTMDRRAIEIGNGSLFTYWEIQTSFRGRGLE
jgi:hypothetical protein